jgi:hypothetical protein
MAYGNDQQSSRLVENLSLMRVVSNRLFGAVATATIGSFLCSLIWPLQVSWPLVALVVLTYLQWTIYVRRWDRRDPQQEELARALLLAEHVKTAAAVYVAGLMAVTVIPAWLLGEISRGPLLFDHVFSAASLLPIAIFLCATGEDMLVGMAMRSLFAGTRPHYVGSPLIHAVNLNPRFSVLFAIVIVALPPVFLWAFNFLEPTQEGLVKILLAEIVSALAALVSWNRADSTLRVALHRKS